MKMNVFLFLMTFIFSGNLYASIDGNWTGWAYWKHQGEGPKCIAEMRFQENPETFALLAGELECDYVAMSIPERVFTKESGELLMDGKSAGKYTEDTFEWSERYNERTVIFVKIKVNGTNMDYNENWIQDENTLLYEVKGRLFKK